MSSLSLSSQVVAASKSVACDMAGEVAILNMRDGMYYELNMVGARIWALIQEPVTLKEVLQELIAEYEVGEEECKVDLLALMEELVDRGLVETL